MDVSAMTTIGELMDRFPNGFMVGPGTKENPGCLSRVLAASSHLSKIAARYPAASGNQGYAVIDMDPES